MRLSSIATAEWTQNATTDMKMAPPSPIVNYYKIESQKLLLSIDFEDASLYRRERERQRREKLQYILLNIIN